MAQPRRVSSAAATRFVEFLRRKWERELDYRLVKELWAFTETASRFASSTNGTTAGQWFRRMETNCGISTSEG